MDYRLAMEECAVRAACSDDEGVRRAWLQLVESYRFLLQLELRTSPLLADKAGWVRFSP
jgi:hypothetical protein